MIYLMGVNNVAQGLVLGGGRPQALTTAATTSWARSQIGRGDSAEVAEGSTKATGKYPFLCKLSDSLSSLASMTESLHKFAVHMPRGP